MKELIIHNLKEVKAASTRLLDIKDKLRDKVLNQLADKLIEKSVSILTENKKDLVLLQKEDPKYDRLYLNKQRILDLATEIRYVASLRFNRTKSLLTKKMPNGLLIKKIRAPLGVIAVIFESRANVALDIFTLCFKSGNACVLKGGKESQSTNNYLVDLIREVLIENHISPQIIYLLPTGHEGTNILLEATGLVDVCIPRGSSSLINYVRQHAKIPVIETGAGVVHAYFDFSGDLEKGQLIINNAKTRRVSVCNALDTLIIHNDRLDELSYLVAPLAEKNVIIYADGLSAAALVSRYPSNLLLKASTEHYGYEFLSYKLAIKTVESIEEAVKHIQVYSSGHSEAIVAEDKKMIDYFFSHIDAAALYANASTAFTDGGQFGMGLEVGISTQKLHVRGPMSLEALTTYKWLIKGNGHIRV